QLRRLEEIPHSRIFGRTIRGRVESNPGAVYATCRSLQKAWSCHADRDQPWLAQRSHSKSIRRYAARDGRERARVRPNRARFGLARVRIFNESEQSENHDCRLSIVGGAIE